MSKTDGVVGGAAWEIKTFRTLLALNQEEMSDLLGIQRAHLSRIESGERAISLRTKMRWEEVRLKAHKIFIDHLFESRLQAAKAGISSTNQRDRRTNPCPIR